MHFQHVFLFMVSDLFVEISGLLSIVYDVDNRNRMWLSKIVGSKPNRLIKFQSESSTRVSWGRTSPNDNVTWLSVFTKILSSMPLWFFNFSCMFLLHFPVGRVPVRPIFHSSSILWGVFHSPKFSRVISNAAVQHFIINSSIHTYVSFYSFWDKINLFGFPDREVRFTFWIYFEKEQSPQNVYTMVNIFQRLL